MLICILQLKSLTGKFVLSINLPFSGVCLLNDGSFIIALRDNLLVCLTSSSIGLSSKACLNESSLHLASALAGIYVIAFKENGKYTLHDDPYVLLFHNSGPISNGSVVVTNCSE